MNKIPPPPQGVAVLGDGGKLSLPWNLWLTDFIRILQQVGDGLDLLGLMSGGSGGVATGGAGPAVDLSAYPSGEGLNNLPARADHLHQMALQAEMDTTDLGTVQAWNCVGPILEIEREPNLFGSLVSSPPYGWWRLEELTGTRYLRLGSGPALSPNGTALTVVSGKYGNAISQTQGHTNSLRATVTGIDFTNGMTLCFWTKLAAAPGSFASLAMSLWHGVGNYVSGDYFTVYRFYNSDYFDFAGPGFVLPGGGRLGPLDTTNWHFICAWIDPATKIAYLEADGGKIRRQVQTTVTLSSLSIDTLDIAGPLGALDSFHGYIDEPMLFNRLLTEQERQLLATSSRANVVANPAAIELFGAA